MAKHSYLVAAWTVAALVASGACGRHSEVKGTGANESKANEREANARKGSHPSQGTPGKAGTPTPAAKGPQGGGDSDQRASSSGSDSGGSSAMTPGPSGGSAGGNPDQSATPSVAQSAPRLRIPLTESIPDPIYDMHIRRTDGAFVVIGRSGVAWLSKDDGMTWAATCSLPYKFTRPWYSTLVSSNELGQVLAISNRLYQADQIVEDAGPCPSLPTPANGLIGGAVISKKRILIKTGRAYSYSDDLGQSWLPVAVNWGEATPSEINDSDFAIDPGNPERMTFATCKPVGGEPTSVGYQLVLRTRSSSAAPFTQVASTLLCNSRTPDIALERDRPDTLYFRSSVTPYASIDGGKSWQVSTAFTYPSVAMPEGGFINLSITGKSMVADTWLATLKVSEGGTTGQFVPKGTFVISEGSTSSSVLRGGKGKFLYLHQGLLHASVDGGLTFKSIKLPSFNMLAPIEVASRDGKTLWAIDRNLRVVMSPDGGQTWSVRNEGQPSSAPIPAQPRMYVHPYNDTALVIHGEKFNSTYSAPRTATTDGFSSYNRSAVPLFDAWASAVGFLSANTAAHFVLNSHGAWKGTATIDAPTLLPLPPANTNAWAPFPDMLSLPTAPASLFFGENGQGSVPRYQAYDVAGGAKRDMLPALALKPAGHSIAHTPQGPRLRIISESGRIRETADGLSFSDVSPDPAFPSCERRLLSSSRANPARLATACLGSKEHGVNVSSNAGKEWTHITAADLQSCGVTQVSITDSKTFVSCSASRQVFVIAK